MTVSLVLFVTGWSLGWWLFWRPRPLTSDTPGRGGLDDVGVVVPARDEVRRLPGLLADLRLARPAPDRVVVVDDRSTDGTPDLVRDAGIEVVESAGPPPGWTGKSWACHVGAQAMDRGRGGDLLVFLDADVRVSPEGLAAVADAQRRLGGLVSVHPRHLPVRLYERLSALFELVAYMGIGAASPRRRGRARGAFGPCLACRREDYEEVGGHAVASAAVAEDLALADGFRRAGHPVWALDGADLVSYRMYPEGLRSLWEGWTKNMATGAGSVGWRRAVLVVLWVTAVATAVQLAVAGAVGDAPLVFGAVAYALVGLQLTAMFTHLGAYGRATPFAFPLLLAAFVVVFARSVWHTVVRREVAWRGRAVPLRSVAPGDADRGP